MNNNFTPEEKLRIIDLLAVTQSKEEFLATRRKREEVAEIASKKVDELKNNTYFNIYQSKEVPEKCDL